jgi:hypothetical protein
MVFELPPYWEQIREESADDLQEYKDIFSDYLLDKRICLLSTRYNGFDLLFTKFDIYTTRFNSHTYLENQRYKENKMNGFSGALYSTTLPFPVNTSDEKYLFVLDMNNTTNRLLGVSFLKNKLAKDQNIIMYADPSFNNYIYKTKFYIDLQDSNPQITESWRKFIETEFERCLFYGKSNMKRGGSFSRFSMKKMKTKHLKFLLSLFIVLNPNNFNTIIEL